MTKIIAFANQKGGVAKTTSAIALAQILSMDGKKVLFLDLDPQENASNTLSLNSDIPSLYDFMDAGEKDYALLSQCFQQVKDCPNITAIHGSIRLSAADMRYTMQGREYILYERLKTYLDNYDVVIIDTPPSLGLLTVNALTCADTVVVPVSPDGYSLQGFHQLTESIRTINCAFNQAVRWELLETNPVSKATLPKFEKKVRDIWTMEDFTTALEVCEDDRLALAIHLAFSCSLRLGEIMGLTWDCLTIDEESIKEHNASLFVEKELQRVSKNAMNVLENKDVLRVFPAVLVSDSTMLVFKKPKTQSSIRRVWLPETVARMLVDWKKQQEEQKMHLGSEYHDYNIVLALPNGRPMEGQVISRLFNALIRKNDLPKVVFHSLRHSSTTYKLKLNNGDMKAVQGDTGHAQLKMVSDVYSHILDEDRRHNAEKMERDFYKKAENQSLVAPEAKPSNAATEQLVNLLNASPELAAQLLQMLTANQAGQAATA